MKRYGVLLLAVLVGNATVGFDAAASGTMPQLAQARSAAQPAAGATRLQIAKIMDPSGFERPMVAITGLIPVGWRTEGSIVWNTKGNCGTGYTVDWSATSPDGRMAAAVFPGMQWSFNNFGAGPTGGCPTLQIGSVQQYLQFLVQRGRPDARILDFRRRQDIEQDYRQLNRNTPMPMGVLRTWVEAGEVLIGYQEQGQEMRESVMAAVILTLNRMQGPMSGRHRRWRT